MKPFSAVLTCTTLLLFTGLLATNEALASEGEEQAVGEAVEKFYSALNAMFQGEMGPMENVWSHADDVTYMGPVGGFRVGWPEVVKDWREQAALKLGGAVRPKDIQVTIGRDLAAVSNYEVGANTGPNGEPIEVVIRATSLFRKENGEWKMIGHHTDLIPDLQD